MWWPRRSNNIARRWKNIVSRKDLIGGGIEYSDGRFAYHSRISALLLDGDKLNVTVEWSAKIPMEEGGYAEGMLWVACQRSNFCLDLASSNGPNAYFFVDTDGCVYFGLDDGCTWSLVPKNIAQLNPEDVVGLS